MLLKDYLAWLKTSEDGVYLRRTINRSLRQIRRNEKPTINYEINQSLTPVVLNSLYQKIYSKQRYEALKLVIDKLKLLKESRDNHTSDDKVKLSESDRQ